MRTVFAFSVVLALVASGCGRKDSTQPQQVAPSATATAQVVAVPQAGVTPMAERVAVLGLLNKRNGIVRDITLKPGQSMRVRDAIVRLRACQTTAPWENEPLTGAFV